VLYLDTSALAKLYIAEPASQLMSKTVEVNSSWLATSRVTYAEVLSVLARCLRANRLSPAAYRLQKKAFLDDWSAMFVVELTVDVLSEVARVIERHGLRGLDAIHLCSALWVGRPSFACFDDRLRSAAVAEGLPLAP
jgi:predicted nucleic acid-binding protein